MRSSFFVTLLSVGFLTACQPTRLTEGPALSRDLTPTFETETILGIPYTRSTNCAAGAACQARPAQARVLDLEQFDGITQSLLQEWEKQQSSIFLYDLTHHVEANILVLKRTLHCIKPRALWEGEGFIMDNPSSMFNLSGTETIRARFSSARYQFPNPNAGLKAQKVEERWSLVSFEPDKVSPQMTVIGEFRELVGKKVSESQALSSRWCTGEEMEKALQRR